MATCEPTKWVILGNGVRTDLVSGGGGLVAQLRLLTEGPPTEIVARVEELGATNARQRLRERLTGNERIEHYRRLRAEAAVIDREINGLQATAGRMYAERAERLALAAPGFSAEVVALDKKAAELQGRIVEAQERGEAIRAAVNRARQDALSAVQIAAADVTTRIGAELRWSREAAVERIALALSPLLTEFAALERASLAAAGGALISDLGGLVEELAATTKVETPEEEVAAQ